MEGTPAAGTCGGRSAAECADPVLQRVDLRQVHAEVLAHLDGEAVADLRVVDEDIERLLDRLREFDDRAVGEGCDLGKRHAALSDLHDQRNFEAENAREVLWHGLSIGIEAGWPCEGTPK